MELKELMKLSIERLLRDVDRISSVIHRAEHEIDGVCSAPNREVIVASMKEELGEAHARLDGIREFVLSCRKRATEIPEEEDIDLWL
ncbi:MAG TPA: hypothetical protein VGA55_00845 [Bacteroidota bacterium]